MRPTSRLKMSPSGSVASFLALLSLLALAPLAAQAPSKEDTVAALKKSLSDNSAALRHYAWIETTIVSVKGEEKSRSQNNCYYDATGKVIKTPIAAAEPEDSGRGGRQRGLKARIVENKTEEMTDYMKAAVAKIQEYVPPDPAKIQAASAAGKVAVSQAADGSLGVDMTDFVQAGDLFGLKLNMKSMQLLSAKVNTYIDSPSDVVTLDVQFQALPDGGPNYSSKVSLDAPAKNINVVIENSGYHFTG